MCFLRLVNLTRKFLLLKMKTLSPSENVYVRKNFESTEKNGTKNISEDSLKRLFNQNSKDQLSYVTTNYNHNFLTKEIGVPTEESHHCNNCNGKKSRNVCNSCTVFKL